MVSCGTEYEHLREIGNTQDTEPSRQEDLRKLHELVRENLHKAYQRYSRPYNLRSNVKYRFHKGDLVHKRNIHQSNAEKKFVGKFGNKYSKAKVRKELGTNTYSLEDENGRPISGVYHGSFLKKA